MVEWRCIKSPSYRSAIGFGAGSVIGLLGMFLSPGTLPWNRIVLLVGFAISGAIGGASLGWGRKSRYFTLITAIGFGIGFLVLGFVIPYPFRYFEEPFPRQETNFGMLFSSLLLFALTYGPGFYIASAIGAAFIGVGLRLALIGAGGFSIGGVIGSALFVISYFFLSNLGPLMRIACFCVGIVVAYAIGGAYLGAAIGSFERENSGTGVS
jgi:hypothetical protein